MAVQKQIEKEVQSDLENNRGDGDQGDCGDEVSNGLNSFTVQHWQTTSEETDAQYARWQQCGYQQLVVKIESCTGPASKNIQRQQPKKWVLNVRGVRLRVTPIFIEPVDVADALENLVKDDHSCDEHLVMLGLIFPSCSVMLQDLSELETKAEENDENAGQANPKNVCCGRP